MTIEKIRENPQHLGGLVSKLNEVIDVVNSLTGGEKEETKSNSLRDTLVIKYGGITNDKYLVQEILSLVKEHLEKEWQELPAYTKNGENIMNKIRNL